MKEAPYRNQDWNVTCQVGRYLVQRVQTGEEFFVLIHLTVHKEEAGPCSCGNRPAIFPDLQCHHQRAVAELKSRANLPNLVHFQPPGRLSVDYQSEMAHFQSSLHRHTRFGFLDCPHCQRRITKEHLDPDRWPALAGQPSAFSVREAEGGTP